MPENSPRDSASADEPGTSHLTLVLQTRETRISHGCDKPDTGPMQACLLCFDQPLAGGRVTHAFGIVADVEPADGGSSEPAHPA
jgi:hypothetical protein